jgi:hypothetical protein
MEGVCSQLEEQLLLWLEYSPQVASYERSDIGPPFARKQSIKPQREHCSSLTTPTKQHPKQHFRVST